ncbi:MFS transporter [Rhizobacter sp. SG703]|uniref:MFS transporter n=1 Tax=Rhizobacter sp. SG703 TaxID=2587140 RepID=UPI0014478D76|nr:MFS transporter [Rhizobacter sp. SG703]NKI93209.1 MFS family permease [Rhizobacter sp. SG703]
MKTTVALPHGPARWALVSLSLSMLLASLGISIATVGLPAMAQAFDVSFERVRWIVLAYLIANTALLVVVGRLGDRVGARRLLLAGIGVVTVASALCGLAPGFRLLLAARVMQGLGAAILVVLALALVGDAVPKARAGMAMGVLGTMSAVGTALGPSLGGLLIAGFGWRAIFLAQVPLGVGAWLLARRHLPAQPTAARTAPAWISSAMWRDPALRAGLAMSALVSTVMMTTLVVGPFHLARALGLDAAAVGLAMSVGPAVAALAGVPAGRLVDRFDASRMTLAGLVGMVLGALALSLLPLSLGVVGYIAALAVVTAGYALFQAANNTAVMAAAGASGRRGMVSGLLNLSRNLGFIAGAAAMGALFAHASAAVDVALAPAHAVARGMHATFAVATALLGVAIAIAAAGRARRYFSWVV